jgi:hypothetical protein
MSRCHSSIEEHRRFVKKRFEAMGQNDRSPIPSDPQPRFGNFKALHNFGIIVETVVELAREAFVLNTTYGHVFIGDSYERISVSKGASQNSLGCAGHPVGAPLSCNGSNQWLQHSQLVLPALQRVRPPP